MADLTLSELVTINDRNLQDVDIPCFMNTSPFMRTNQAVIASHDTIHKWLVYDNPDAGFRDVNTGRTLNTSVDSFNHTNCKILDASFQIDLALAQSYAKGGSAGWVNREASRALDSAFFKAETQVFNGTATGATGDSDDWADSPGTGDGDNDGFYGLPNYFGSLSQTNGVVNAGGSTALTSVWLVRSAATDVEIITGRSGDISMGDTTIQRMADAISPAITSYPTLYTPIHAWYALKVSSPGSGSGSRPSCVRICNVDAGSNTVTDDLIFSALEKFGVGYQPTHIYMNRRSREQLRSSRTATNGTGSPAPLPTEVGGLPVVVTDGITNSEAAVT